VNAESCVCVLCGIPSVMAETSAAKRNRLKAELRTLCFNLDKALLLLPWRKDSDRRGTPVGYLTEPVEGGTFSLQAFQQQHDFNGIIRIQRRVRGKCRITGTGKNGLKG